MEGLAAFVGGILLLALVVSLGVGIIAAIGWFLFVVVLPIAIIIGVGYFVYQAAKSHLARQGRDISEFLPALPKWTDIPAELREFGGYWVAFAAGVFGLVLPGMIGAGGEAINTIAVISTLLIFSWAIPLAIYNLLNSASVRNEVRFPLIAFLAGYAFSVAAHIHPVVFLFLTALTGGYGWWWYEHHPYLKMRVAHARCKTLHDAATLLSAEDFLKSFHEQFIAKWGFAPSPITMEEVEMLYWADSPREIPVLPELPPFQPVYAPGRDITYQLTHLETVLWELPVKTEKLVAGITGALDAYTTAVPRAEGASVFTVAAREMVPDLPGLVHALGTALPTGFNARSNYERKRDAVSQGALSVKAYESGERIEPEAYANV